MGKEKSAPKKPASPLADEIQDPAKIVSYFCLSL